MNDQFLDFIKKRGFVSQCTDEENLKKTLKKKQLDILVSTVLQIAYMLVPYYP